jgi:OmpA-OmpF porin, OOP family
MRPLAFVLLASGLIPLSSAAWPQAEPPATADDYVCEFTGECPVEAAAEDEAPAGNRPRISASRGFALSGRGSSGTASAPRSTPPRRTTRRQSAGPGQRVNLRLGFETGSAVLTAAARVQAEAFAQALQRPQLRNLRFQIEGHTDSVGSRASNIALSQRRAQSVADFLAGKGVERSRLAVRGYGPDRPLPGLRASAGENRRVEAVRIN